MRGKAWGARAGARLIDHPRQVNSKSGGKNFFKKGLYFFRLVADNPYTQGQQPPCHIQTMTTQQRQAEIQAYREYPTRAGSAMVGHIEQSRRYKYIYISSALRRAIGEGSIAGLKCRLDGKEVRLFFSRYGRSTAHHYKAYAKYADDWSPVKTEDLPRMMDVTLNN